MLTLLFGSVNGVGVGVAVGVRGGGCSDCGGGHGGFSGFVGCVDTPFESDTRSPKVCAARGQCGSSRLACPDCSDLVRRVRRVPGVLAAP